MTVEHDQKIESSEERKYNVGCVSQGIPDRLLTLDELGDWIKAERNFWNSIRFPHQLLIENRRRDVQPVQQTLDALWAAIESEKLADRPTLVLEQIEEARELRMILSEGTIAKALPELIREDHVSAFLVAARYIPELVNLTALGNDVVSFNARMFAPVDTHPSLSRLHRVGELNDLVESASTAQKSANRLVSELTAELQNRVAQFEALGELYQSKLMLEGPSEHWQTVAENAQKVSYIWLGAFVAMILLPMSILIYNWSAVLTALQGVLQQSQGFSLTALTLVTAPILGYGWILKHVSRGYIQNGLIAADARHRRVMAMTYLGLAKSENTGIGEGERALILNALFRPAPPSSPGDDGPPTGLLDLIKR
jgi:hypothetical protein